MCLRLVGAGVEKQGPFSNLLPRGEGAFRLVHKRKAVGLAGLDAFVDARAITIYAAREHVLPDGGEPPVAGMFRPFDDARLGAKELDIDGGRAHHLRLTVGALAVKEFRQGLRNLTMA